MKFEVGFVGLGVMGSAMAAHILRAGHKLIVYNRTPSKSVGLGNSGADIATTLRELAEKSDFIFICAGDGASVKEIIFGKENENLDCLVFGLRPGAIIIDHSTISPDESLSLSNDLNKIGIDFLDAPVTGGDVGARNGTLISMIGGEAEAVDKVKPLLGLYCKKIVHVGKNGFGQKMKAVNQIGAIGGVALVTELMRFAEMQGLNLEMTINTLMEGAAGSFALSNYAPKIVAGDFKPGFSVKHSKKDVGIVLAQGHSLNLPMMEATFKSLNQAEALGLSEEGNHSLYKLKGEK